MNALVVHKVLVFGGRDFNDADAMSKALTYFWKTNGQFAVIEGGARGADRHARSWARSNGLPVLTVDADWHSYGKAAGAVRNGWMLTYGAPTYAIGFPGGNGTADMRKRVEQMGIPLWLPLG